MDANQAPLASTYPHWTSLLYPLPLLRPSKAVIIMPLSSLLHQQEHQVEVGVNLHTTALMEEASRESLPAGVGHPREECLLACYHHGALQKHPDPRTSHARCD